MKILLLAGNTLRARAYAQQLTHLDPSLYEIEGVFYGFDNNLFESPILNIETKRYFDHNKIFIPDFSESLEETFKINKWSFVNVNNRDVNSEAVLNEIDLKNCDIVVFAGYGGQLLKNNHFVSSKQYLHMHPGELPLERGSTTIYYSILNKRDCTVTAFFMTEKIDSGKNILFSKYSVPNKNVDIDQWFDNVIRADCFIHAIPLIKVKKDTNASKKNKSEEYYVIHPVLKHIALLSLK